MNNKYILIKAENLYALHSLLAFSTLFLRAINPDCTVIPIYNEDNYSPIAFYGKELFFDA